MALLHWRKSSGLLAPTTVNHLPHNKLIGLEALRFIAALAVLVWHYQHFYYAGAAPIEGFVRSQQPGYWALAWLYEFGNYGVEAFWCISGFIFFWKYSHAIAERQVGARQFFIYRFSRLYPLHLATLLLVAALQWAYTSQQGHAFVYQHNDLYHFLLQLGFASHWGAQAGYSFNGPVWSISVEVLVYGLFFCLLRAGMRHVWVNIALVLACIALRPPAEAASPSPILDCILFFYSGGLAAVAMQALERSPWASQAWWALPPVLIAVPYMAWALGVFQNAGLIVWFVLAFVPLLLMLAGNSRLNIPARFHPIIETLGNTTYSSYLCHFPLQLVFALGFHAMGKTLPVGHVGFLVFYITATLLIAVVVYRVFEMPCQVWLRKRLR